MIAFIPSRDPTRSRNVLSAGTWFIAVGEYHRRPLSLVGEAPTVRLRPFLAVSSETYSAQLAALLNRARAHSDEAPIASSFRCRIIPGDRVKCAANAVRDQRCGMLGMSHSAEVQRFGMHAQNA